MHHAIRFRGRRAPLRSVRCAVRRTRKRREAARSTLAPGGRRRHITRRRGRDGAAGGGGGRPDHRRGDGRPAPAPPERWSMSRRSPRRCSAACCPSACPELPGLEVAARYVPGAADAQVGGDWYDVIALRDGHAAIAIGDVVGHGLDAAARMARLQNALRAYALEGLRPSLVLERMNGVRARGFRRSDGDPDVRRRRPRRGPPAPRDRRPPAAAGDRCPTPTPTSPRARPAARSASCRSRPTRRRRSRSSPAPPSCSTRTGSSSARDVSLDEGLEWLRGFARGGHGAPGRALRRAASGALRRRCAARRRRAARRPDRAGLARAHRAHPARRARVARADAPGADALAARGRRQRHRDLRDAGRDRRGLRQRGRPRLPARRGLLRGRGAPRRRRRSRSAFATSARGARRARVRRVAG